MDEAIPTPKAPRRWLKSLIVLLIGLAYLAVVYWASPALRAEMRFRGVWYMMLRVPRPQNGYRVQGDRSLRGFEKRLVSRAKKTVRVRMTVEVTERWRVTTLSTAESGERAEFSPVRECRFTATLLMEGTGGGHARGRVRLLVEEGDSWRAWVFDGEHGWYLLSDTSSHPPGETRRRLSSGDMSSASSDELEPVIANQMAPLWPFVVPDAFVPFLRGTRVSPGGKADVNGVPCRIVRIERRWAKSSCEVCKLWMPEGDDRVVRVEYTPAWDPDFVEKLTPEELAELGTFCVVTSYEEPASFEADAFDPTPLLKKWSDAVTANVARDIEQMEERKTSPPDAFGAASGFEGSDSGLEPPEKGPQE